MTTDWSDYLKYWLSVNPGKAEKDAYLIFDEMIVQGKARDIEIETVCKNCKSSYWDVRGSDIPENVKWIQANFCPLCEDEATEYLSEKHMTTDRNPKKEIKVSHNQLRLF